MIISHAQQFGVFVNAFAGCAMIFGVPLVVDLVIRQSLSDRSLSDAGALLTYLAVATMIAFMINLGLFFAASYSRARYIAGLVVIPIVAAGLYAIAYLALLENATTPTPAPE